MNPKDLVVEAKKAMLNAYSPYSNFKVGAALLTQKGKLYTGCNVENVSYGGSICAERVAFTKAISEGERIFETIAIASSGTDLIFPCGICRQFMAEFGTNLIVIVSNPTEIKSFKLTELLPYAFDKF